MRNFKLVLCYDGSSYDGWQKQGNTSNTIQEKLEQLLSRLLEQPVEVAGSGRTDAGVHAYAQVCSFHAQTELACEELLAGIRQYLPKDIGAVSLEEAEPRFHARLNAAGKTYVYRIWRGSEPNVFERKYLYFFSAGLDVNAMRQAADLLLGTHDFTSFCANRRMKKSAVRTLQQIELEERGSELRISFSGDGFLYNMVRILTGTLLEVGTGKLQPQAMPAILEGKNRDLAGFTAPACGLALKEVWYN